MASSASSSSAEEPGSNPNRASSGAAFGAAVDLLKNADRVIFFTGAGMSAESGISPFRTPDGGGIWSGLWGKVVMVYGATPLGWKLSPKLVWSYFVRDFLRPIVTTQPHEGYFAITRLQKSEKFRNKLTVATMNVDGLHALAGSADIREVHGSVLRFICAKCRRPMRLQSDLRSLSEKWGDAPLCGVCGGSARPDCTLFCEGLPQEEWFKVNNDLAQLSERSVVIVVGTSSVVYPAASIPERAVRRGARVIEINPDPGETPLSDLAEVRLRGTAKHMLKKLVEAVLEE